jgi:hypothetical protein
MALGLGKRALGALTGMMMSVALAGEASAATQITASVDPVTSGQDVTFTFTDDDIVDLISFDIGFSYDAGLLEFLSAAPGSSLPGASDPSNFFAFDDGAGNGFLSFAASSAFTGSATIFTATFRTLGGGNASFSASGQYFQEGTGTPVPLSGTTSVTIAAIPEPATWAMMILGFGIAGTALRSQRRRSLAHA